MNVNQKIGFGESKELLGFALNTFKKAITDIPHLSKSPISIPSISTRGIISSEKFEDYSKNPDKVTISKVLEHFDYEIKLLEDLEVNGFLEKFIPICNEILEKDFESIEIKRTIANNYYPSINLSQELNILNKERKKLNRFLHLNKDRLPARTSRRIIANKPLSNISESLTVEATRKEVEYNMSFYEHALEAEQYLSKIISLLINKQQYEIIIGDKFHIIFNDINEVFGNLSGVIDSYTNDTEKANNPLISEIIKKYNVAKYIIVKNSLNIKRVLQDIENLEKKEKIYDKGLVCQIKKYCKLCEIPILKS